MKSTYLTLGLLLISITTVFAQTTPQPPKTSNVSCHSNSTSEYSSSTTVNGSDNSEENISVSTSNSEYSYKFRARFGKSKTAKVKRVLLERLGKTKLKVSGSKYEWIIIKNDDEVFECKLTIGGVRIFVNKEEVSNYFSNEIKDLGKELRIVIAGNESKKHQQRALERAQQELERAKINLERVKSRVN